MEAITTTIPTPRLLTLPSELLTDIALTLALLDTPLGPPKFLVPLLCSCRALYELCTSEALLALIFKHKFDYSAPRRRLHHRTHHYTHNNAVPSSLLAAQLKRWCRTLAFLRTPNSVYLPQQTLTPVLWSVFTMLLESDGRNYVQLVRWAGVRVWVGRFVRERLWEGRNDGAEEGEGGWPKDSMCNALALWILWMVEDEEHLRNETPEQRQEMISLVLPYVYAAFRYPAFHVSDIHFRKIPVINASNSNTSGGSSSSAPVVPHLEMPRTVRTAHGDYPLYPPINPYAMDYYTSPSPSSSSSSSSSQPHSTALALASPLTPLAAQLIYFSRRSSLFSPLYPPPNIPHDRGEAPVGYVGPTGADYERFNACRGVLFGGQVGGGGGDDETRQEEGYGEERSRVWDTLWERLVGCWDPWMGVRGGAGSSSGISGGLGGGGGLGVARGIGGREKFRKGSLEGLWVGKMLIPDEPSYFSSITTPALSPLFSEMQPFMAVRPVYMRLREYWVRCPGEEVWAGGVGVGVGAGVGGELGGGGRARGRGRGRERERRRQNPTATTTMTSGTDPTPLEIFDEGVRNGWLRPRVEVWEDERCERAYVRDPDPDVEGKVWVYERGLGGGGEEGEGEGERRDDGAGKCGVCGSGYAGVGVGVVDEEEVGYEDEGDVDGDVYVDADMEVDIDIDIDEDEDEDEDMVNDIEDAQEGYDESYQAYQAFEDVQAELRDALREDGRHPHLYTRGDGDEDEDEDGDGDGGCGAYRDVLIVGQTDKVHGDAWGSYKFYGRMRRWDGLVAIVAVPSNRTQTYLGKWIYRGYVLADRMFVGRWRLQDYDVDVPPYEGAFVACREDE